jgi:pimeloyl-ACP methyl ester carboxylesterase
MDARLALVAGIVVAGCSFSFERFAADYGLQSSRVTTDNFRHLALSRPGTGASHRLYVYIEGDGIPWIGGTQPARDPTPANPLALRLMAVHTADPAAHLAYLGRPCYFGLSKEPGCGPSTWTSDRYSPRVIASMAAAAETLVAAGNYTELVLIGLSGGGTVARLMAPKIPQVAGLMTINANLHVASWVSARGYQPLSGSLDPVDEAPLPTSVRHVQVIGLRDAVVPAAVTDSYRERHDDLVVWKYADFDHVCCWLSAWPDILARFDEHLALAGSTRASQ